MFERVILVSIGLAIGIILGRLRWGAKLKNRCPFCSTNEVPGKHGWITYYACGTQNNLGTVSQSAACEGKERARR